MKLDILVIMAHPDDAELSCSGTIISSVKMGLKVGMIDLTKGELGTRGNETIRIKEANDSAKLMQVEFRDNLNLKDSLFKISNKNKLKIVQKIRQYRPNIVITNSIKDRHPDHEKASNLVNEACFISGLRKFKSMQDDVYQESWRPEITLFSIQDSYVEPDFIIDVSKYFKDKLKTISCFKSQFYDSKSIEPKSYISSKHFMKFIESRSIEFGHAIGVDHGEGFKSSKKIRINNIYNILGR